MMKFNQNAGAVVAADVQSTVAAVDDALLNGARMYVSVLEAAHGSNLPVAHSQRVLRSMTSGLSAVVEGRGELVSAVRQLSLIKSRSNFAPEAYGCPEGWDVSASADLAVEDPVTP
jgi:hypothetical protein